MFRHTDIQARSFMKFMLLVDDLEANSYEIGEKSWGDDVNNRFSIIYIQLKECVFF